MILFFWISQFLSDVSISLFWTAATVGTTLFILRVLMAAWGGFADFDDTSHDFSDEYADHHDHHTDTPSFKLLTLHSFSGFLMLFGWTGLACTEQLTLSVEQSFFWAILFGLSGMVLIALLFRAARLFESGGSAFSIYKTKGLLGTVYQRIPEDGVGKVQVFVDGGTREILARSMHGVAIESFSLVKVVRVIDYETVIVELTEGVSHD